MTIRTDAYIDVEKHIDELHEKGYTVVLGLLSDGEVNLLQKEMDAQIDRQLDDPWDPGDGPAHPDDDEISTFYRSTYPTCPEEEYARLMRLTRYTRHQNCDTPWPVSFDQVLKNFHHRPAVEDDGMTVYLHELAARASIFSRLAEDDTLVQLSRSVLGDDCVLSDVGGNSIGPGTAGGAWHVDAPLGQFPEPLPDFVLTTQNIWMVEDFTPDNGATRLVPRSHKSLKKPAWKRGSMEGEVALTGPAGSVAIWLSSTWHRAGPNKTEHPRRAVMCDFCRSWIKGWSDFRPTVTGEMASTLSPTLRYLLGFSSNPIVRG